VCHSCEPRDRSIEYQFVGGKIVTPPSRFLVVRRGWAHAVPCKLLHVTSRRFFLAQRAQRLGMHIRSILADTDVDPFLSYALPSYTTPTTNDILETLALLYDRLKRLSPRYADPGVVAAVCKLMEPLILALVVAAGNDVDVDERVATAK
jgi:hypothetical protein